MVAARNTDMTKRNPKLERAIFDDPADDAAWQVYGDWLQQHHDPHGELISLELQRASAGPDEELELSARINELMTEHRDAWLGDAARLVDKAGRNTPRVDLQWERGYIVNASVSVGDEKRRTNMPWPGEVVYALLESPAVLFLRELRLVEPNCDYLTEEDTKLEALTSLTIQDNQWCVVEVLSSTPRLRRLRMCCRVLEVRWLEHEVLEEVRFESLDFEGSAVRTIATSKLPAIKRLELHFGVDEHDTSGRLDEQRLLRQLLPLFTNEGLPKLEHLGLENIEFQDEVALEIATSPLLKQLRTLSLSRGNMQEFGAQAIIEYADNFAHLERLDLSRNNIPNELCAQIEAALPGVELELSRQNESDPDDEPDWLYESDSE